jgi:hypothetical protein
MYNLRSTVNNGTRTIYWSASQRDIEDCVFGIWYSSETPVGTNRPPDATVWYSPLITDYQTSFAQNAPAYAAVGVMRPNEVPETVQKIFLDWSHRPPFAPEDVMVLDTPLPASDERRVVQDDPSLVLWG